MSKGQVSSFRWLLEILRLRSGQVLIFSLLIGSLFTGMASGALQVTSPSPPANITIHATENANSLSWTPVKTRYGPVEGYNIYRSTAAEGPYVKINPTLIKEERYVDPVTDIEDHFYKISAVDFSGIEGPLSSARKDSEVFLAIEAKAPSSATLESRNKKIKLVIPPQGKDVSIKITTVPTPRGIKPISDVFDITVKQTFGETTLKAPATITIKINGNLTPFSRIQYFDGRDWQYVAGGTYSIDLQNNTIAYDRITHFSYYTVTNPSNTSTPKAPATVTAVAQVTPNIKVAVESWSRRKPVTIDNSSNANILTDYQVKVDVAYDSDMNADFSDLRFTDSDGTTLLFYWIESYTPSTSATVWVKVPSIPASSTKTIYMYYGNSTATSASNGDNTFDFFDDFSSGSIQSSKWSTSGGTWTVENGWAKEGSAFYGDGLVSTYSGSDYIAELKTKMTYESGTYNYLAIFVRDQQYTAYPHSKGYGSYLYKTQPDLSSYLFKSDGTSLITLASRVELISLNTVYNVKCVVGGSSIKIYVNGTLWFSATDATYASGKVGLGKGADEIVYFDDVRVRKYTSPEPTTSAGAEDWVDSTAVAEDTNNQPEDISGYIVYRWVYAGTTPTADKGTVDALFLPGNTTSYTDNTGIPGETYYYGVSAENTGGFEGAIRLQDGTNPTVTVAGSEKPHNSYQTTSNMCRDCHEIHGPKGTELLERKATEKDVCFTCHDGTGSTTNVKGEFAYTYRHPVGESPTLPRTTVLQCRDCHSPHLLDQPSHTAPGNVASNALKNTWGVEPNPWPTPNVQPRNIPAFPGSSLTLGGGVTIIKAGNYFYAVSGGSTYFWRYNPSNNAWQRMASAPGSFANGAALAYAGGNYIFAFQGGTAAFWAYSIPNDNWTTLDPPDTPGSALTGAGAALAWAGGNYIFAFRGGTQAAFWAYSIPNNNWTTLDPTDAPGTVAAGGALAWDGGNYIFAFQGGTAAFWAYHITNNNWTTLDPPDTPSSLTVGAGGSLCYPGSGDYIYALRGGTQTTFWAYSKTNNNWTTLDPADAPAAVGTNSGNRLAGDGGSYIYCLRGETNGEFWRYKMNTSWNDGQAAPSAYTVVKPIQKEYQLCLKCHSNYTTQPTGQMNLAEAINPMTASHHPIAAPAANRYCDNDTMEAPWNAQENDVSPLNQKHDTMYCSDCHGSNVNDTPGETTNPTDPLGPHGSNQTKILRATIASDSTNGTPLCYICHKKTMYWSGPITGGSNGTRFGDHPSGESKHKTAQGCLDCHIGGDGVAQGRDVSWREYIHGSNMVKTVDTTNRGPAHAFEHGDGMKYVRQADMSCWTEGTCGTQHSDKKPTFYAP